MQGVAAKRCLETWDRLVLLLIARAREGCEPEFKEITRQFLYDAGHGQGGRPKLDRGARGLRGPRRHGSGQALGLQARHGARLPLEEELPTHTSSQPLACYGADLVREERQRVGNKGGGSGTWQVGAAIV